mgnify:CR=1 FL=1
MGTIDICVCTFRRPSVVDTLVTIARQSAVREWQVRVIVADNDEQPSAREAVEATARDLGLAVTYVHAPSRNISIARNACLDAVSAEWVSFIDDDEVAPPDWLERLLARRDEHDIVFGRSQAVYDPHSTAAWMIAADLHSNRISGNDLAHNGYTCNVLLRQSWLDRHRLRFDLQLGLSGGEDTIFFEQAQRVGARFGYAEDAVVFEDVPPHRATLGWLLKRRFRAGQIHRRVLRERGAPVARSTAMAVAKAGFCGGATLVDAFRPARRAQHLLRGTLHIGFIASALGARTYQEYAGAGAGAGASDSATRQAG